LTWGKGVPPRDVGFPAQTKARGRDRVGLTPEMAGIKKSARGAVALLLANFAHREHRHRQMPPQPSPRKDKSTAHRATHRPTTAPKGDTQGKGVRGACKMLKLALKASPSGYISLIKFLGLGPIMGGPTTGYPSMKNQKNFRVGHIKTGGGRSPSPRVCLSGPKIHRVGRRRQSRVVPVTKT